MHLHELQQSDNPYEQLKGNLLTIEELTSWVNRNMRVDPMFDIRQDGPTGRHFVEVNFTHGFLDTILTTGCAPLKLTRYIDADICFHRVNQLLGKPYISEDNEYTWSLAIDEWPVVTMEMIERSFHVQEQYKTHVVPVVLTKYLALHFPNADYLNLLDLYKHGMLVLRQKDDPAVPVLRDILHQLHTQEHSYKLHLPADLGMS